MEKVLRICFFGLLFISVSTLTVNSAENDTIEGIINVKSKYSVAHTADRFKGIVLKKGMTVMAHVKHDKGAKNVGIDLKPTELVIFGNPKIGSPMMVCTRSIAIDLPQKLLVWEDDKGQVWMSYNDPVYIADRHKLSQDCRATVKKASGALKKFTHKAGT